MPHDPAARNGTAAPPTPPPAPEAAPAVEPLLLTAPEAARALAVSPRTLWARTRSGEIVSVRIGRSVRYAREDLAAYVERLRAQARRGGA
jgi:excisionase family DNA binding protein